MKKQLVAFFAVSIILLIAQSVFLINTPLLIIFNGITTIILIAAACFVIFKLFKPLNALTAQINRIAENDFSSDDTLVYKSEMEDLHRSIGVMAANLKQKIGLSEAILSNIITPMCLVDTEGRLQWLNEAMVTLTGNGGTPEDHHGNSFSEFFYGDHRETVTGRALRERNRLSVKTEFDNHKGETKYISVISAPIEDMDGQLLGGFTTVMDFTGVVLKERKISSQNERIAEAVKSAYIIAERVSEESDKLSAQLEQSSKGAEEQRMRTTETATAVEQMNSTILEVSRNAGYASETADNAQQTAKEGSQVVAETVSAMDNVMAKASELQASMNDLGKQAEGIGQIIAVINDIADQTNLLALNAAIEAARAGDAGRGFAVVADEVRKLAEKTMQATSEVNANISAIQDSANKNIAVTNEAGEVIKHTADLTHKAGDALETILSLVDGTSDQVRGIATAAEEQSAASEQINRSTYEINKVSTETAESMAESLVSVSSLTELSGELHDVMERMQEN